MIVESNRRATRRSHGIHRGDEIPGGDKRFACGLSNCPAPSRRNSCLAGVIRQALEFGAVPPPFAGFCESRFLDGDRELLSARTTTRKLVASVEAPRLCTRAHVSTRPQPHVQSGCVVHTLTSELFRWLLP